MHSTQIESSGGLHLTRCFHVKVRTGPEVVFSINQGQWLSLMDTYLLAAFSNYSDGETQ